MNKGRRQEESVFADVFRDPVMNRMLFIAVFAIILVVAFYIGRFWPSSLSGDPTAWGAFGDYFAGILNPILGFFTLLVVLATVYYTKQMLDTTREEMRNAQKEMALQNFDTKVFFMLRLFREVRQDLTGPTGERVGHKAFEEWLFGEISAVSNTNNIGITKVEAENVLHHFSLSIAEIEEFNPYISSLVGFLTVVNLMGHWNDAHVKLGRIYTQTIASFMTQLEFGFIYLYLRTGHAGYRDEELLREFLESDAQPYMGHFLRDSIRFIEGALQSK